MLMNDSEVEERLESDKNLVQIIKKKNIGRGRGDVEIPKSVRELISITRNKSEESDRDIGDTFGVSQPTVSRSGRGLISDRLDRDLQRVGMKTRESHKIEIEDREQEAHQAALDVLMTSLTSLQPKLLDPELKAKDISTIAANMSKVASNMKGDKKEGGVVNNTQVILFAPEKRTLDKYDFVEA